MKKLLNQSFRVFLGYAAIVLALSIPAYYYLTDRIWQHELTEHNELIAAGLRHNFTHLNLRDSALAQSITLWNRLQPERQMLPVASVRPDSVYTIYRINPYVAGNKEDRFQGLVTYFMINNQPYSLTVETNIEESHETIWGITAVSVLFFVVLLIGLLLLNRRLSARLWQPFYESLRKIGTFQLHQHEAITLNDTDIAEFTELNRSLDQLIAGNIAAYRQQQQFIENASHELQTPLAIVQSKLDLFLQDLQLTGNQSALVEQAQAALSRVNRINRNLLLLARLDNRQFTVTEPVSLSQLLDTDLSLLDVFIAEKQLQCTANIASDVLVQAHPALPESIVMNLLSNAVRYTPEQGIVQVQLTNQILIIANEGNEPLLETALFKRFGRVTPQAPSTGLGLAIVHEACSQLGWKLQYARDGRMHRFTVHFTV